MAATVQPPSAHRTGRSTRPRTSRRTTVAAAIAVLALIIGAGATLAAGYLGYRVEPGDTLSEIAERYGVSVEELAALNDIDNPDLIVTGDDLMIRPLQDGDDPAIIVPTHVVIEGDTLSELAAVLGVTVEELAAANGLADPDLIVPGMILRVPVVAKAEMQQVEVEIVDPAPADDASVEEPAEAVDEAVSEEPAEADDEAVTETTGDEDETATTESSDEEATSTPERVSNEPANSGAANQSPTASLHLVLPGETVDSIAANYGLTAAQLLAANGHARNGVTAGIILRIPPADAGGVQLIGMPSAVEASAVGSELTAVTVATSYWGSAVSEGTLLEALESSDNPHLGFRGDYSGEYGGTDNYGTYAGPLAEAIAAHGFVGEVFYADGDASALTSRIDSGLPVVVWMTYQAAEASTERVDDGVRPFTLVTGKQAAVVYGYDDSGVLIVDLSTGGYSHIDWDAFMQSWGYFDGMGLAISPI